MKIVSLIFLLVINTSFSHSKTLAQIKDSIRVTIHFSSLRDEPSFDSKTSEEVYFNQEAIVLEVNEYYWKVKIGNKVGFVKEDNILNSPEKKTAKENYIRKKCEFRKGILEKLIESKIINKNQTNIKKFFESFINHPPKGEYELNNEYEKRSKLDEAVIQVFEIRKELLESKIVYNADKEAFIINLDFHNSNRLKVKMLNETINLGSYIGENAFGVKRKISKYKIIEHSIIGLNYYKSLKNLNNQELEKQIEINILRSLAPKIKNNIAIKVGVSFPSLEKFERLSYNSNPTINDPKEISFQYYNVLGNVIWIAIYNKKSSDIYDFYINDNFYEDK